MSTPAPRREEFGPYRILALIGEGGGGVVYRAWDPRLRREVALKVLHRRGGGPVRAERFVAEARAASALNHPNIVHRDLKPENSMPTGSGRRVKIVDFGLAQPSGFQLSHEPPGSPDTQTQTDAGLRVGSVPYMSREQARGSSSDFHSDRVLVWPSHVRDGGVVSSFHQSFPSASSAGPRRDCAV